MSDETAAETRESGAAYRVLARTYRPATFADLIGQEPLVRTLSNAIQSGRVAHAFILTGVRGVGKTTTARILARALNCVGPDGQGGPTPDPCGQCEHCRAIAEDRHVDVIEMDAASRTGIDDIREIIEGVRYRPISARHKIYIIDEVHMLSRQAFNGLLKTLEEPPERVVFIFATTEIRKVPVTVLSRCQRFDLRRVESAVLSKHFAGIAEREGVEVAPEALALIVRAADGSVRDGLSLLDQAIALSGGTVEAAAVAEMLGLADRARIGDLFEAVMGGRIGEALGLFAEMDALGVDPHLLLQDLLELVHLLTRRKLSEGAAEGLTEAEAERVARLAEALSIGELSRAWQILLKGVSEAQIAPRPRQAVEMVLVRLAHASPLPTPGELVRRLASGDGAASASTTARPAAPAPSSARADRPTDSPREPRNGPDGRPEPPPEHVAPEPVATGQAAPTAARETRQEAVQEGHGPQPASLIDVVELARSHREVLLAAHLLQDIHLVRFEPGRFEFRPGPHAPADLAKRLTRQLQDWTGRRWIVSVSQAEGQPTLAEQQRALEEAKRAELLEDPLVKAALAAFPGARIVARRDVPSPQDESQRSEPTHQDGEPRAIAPEGGRHR